MIARALFAVVLLAASPSGGAPSAAPRIPLREISASAATDVCGNVVVHANAAILTTLRDDAAIARVVSRLKTNDFETFGAARRAALADLARTSNDLVENVERGKSETHRLRDFALHPAGGDRSAELLAFADPLDAALDDQRKVAEAIAAFVTAIDYRDLREGARQAAAVKFTDPDDPDTFHSGGRSPTALSTPGGPTTDREAPSATISARTQANDLEAVMTQIAQDEARAALRSEPAVGGC